MSSQLGKFCYILRAAIALVIASEWLLHQSALARPLMVAQSPEATKETSSLCPTPALSRVESHSVGAGETVESIAAAYDLLPITILGMNPTIQAGTLTPGTTLRIPPFNGIEVSVSAGQTWQDIAASYQSRADVLFEVNGCPTTMPSRLFVPGVNWLQGIEATSNERSTTVDDDPLTGYPLSQVASILTGFGWQPHPDRDELYFSSGVVLEASETMSVLAAGDGTVAYVGEEGELKTLIVINHAEGLQTRYALVSNPIVSAGDQVQMGQELAMTTVTGEAAVLYFEVRTNSDLGWVARDPGEYIPALAVR
ncbi:MAG: M23 family metallopeptidase [Cyanobacteria bacterium P01_F01_bin.86]